MNKLTTDAQSALFALLIGAGLLAAAFIGTDIEVYLFPRIAAVLIALLAAMHLISLWRQNALFAVGSAHIFNWQRLLPAIGIMLLYLVSLEFIGFYTSSVLAFLVICLLYGKRAAHHPRAFAFKLAVSGGFMAILYAVFWVMLHVRTPTGWLF